MFHCSDDRAFHAFIIYISMLLDNVLLTVIVPILPDYLAQLKSADQQLINVPKIVVYKNFDLHYVPTILGKHPLTGNSLVNFTISSSTTTNNIGSSLITTHLNNRETININNNNNNNNNNPNNNISDEYLFDDEEINNKIGLAEENGSIGILLATKALVQLVITPLVGNLTVRLGYRIPIVFGTFCLLIASIVFATGNSYITLILARSLQGVASACIGVCGMSLIAQLYVEEEKRSKIMGIILGSVALGVLLGYPFGGILYDFVGISAPFYILAVCIAAVFVLQLLTMNLKDMKSEVVSNTNNCSKCCVLLMDNTILKIIIAIWISTSAMAILEPCLPIWLMENLHPKKWQIGTVFIPDSIGYFIGTNFFAAIAYRVGQMNISIFSLILVGLSSFVIPAATSVLGLLVPHFSLGLGIGILDAALIPMLASLVDTKCNDDDSSSSSDTISNYGAVYAIQQMSVSLAYSMGPIIGGEMAQYMGFKWLMFMVGSINIFYGLFLLISTLNSSLNCRVETNNSDNIHLTNSSGITGGTITTTGGASITKKDYKRFYNTMEIP